MQVIVHWFFAALIESDAEGIGGSGFVECIREHIHSVSSFHILALIFNQMTRFLKRSS